MQREAAKRFEDEHKPGALMAWKRTGGTEAEFNERWPQMREELRLDAIRTQQARAKAATSAQYRQVF